MSLAENMSAAPLMKMILYDNEDVFTASEALSVFVMSIVTCCGITPSARRRAVVGHPQHDVVAAEFECPELHGLDVVREEIVVVRF